MSDTCNRTFYCGDDFAFCLSAFEEKGKRKILLSWKKEEILDKKDIRCIIVGGARISTNLLCYVRGRGL